MFLEPGHRLGQLKHNVFKTFLRCQGNKQTADYVLCWLGTEKRRCYFVNSAELVNLLLNLWQCAPLTRACYMERGSRNIFLIRPNSWSGLTPKIAVGYNLKNIIIARTAKYASFSS